MRRRVAVWQLEDDRQGSIGSRRHVERLAPASTSRPLERHRGTTGRVGAFGCQMGSPLGSSHERSLQLAGASGGRGEPGGYQPVCSAPHDRHPASCRSAQHGAGLEGQQRPASVWPLGPAEPTSQARALHPPVIEVEFVDHEAVFLEPAAGVRGDASRRLGGRQRGCLQRPSGRRHNRDSQKSNAHAHGRPSHAPGRYSSIVS